MDYQKGSWKSFAGKMRRLLGLVWDTAWKIGREDPRRVIHSVKVGLSLTLVSLLYLTDPLFQGFRNNAMWAVMTVVVLFEFTVGATATYMRTTLRSSQTGLARPQYRYQIPTSTLLNQASNMLPEATATASPKCDKESGVHLPTVKTETSALSNQSKESARKVLRPSLSKIARTSLEFSEALPFAAFASLLVEMVARLDLVIEEVEELGRLANFKDFKPGDEIILNCETPRIENIAYLQTHLPLHGAE
ncbi:hypothetical protein HHK36_028539 [Tetracentron sinense]|uniref:Uncharacterized protein n=1 Tax=Tetracentron sinense TaxID=13715 RepID=A0A834YHI8_TETSI|nr:hypothetical protein HHK36_028539 [Tetracentron sinense]